MRDHFYCAIYRLTVLQHSSTPSPALIQLLGNMIGLLGLDPPSDESSTTMAGLMGMPHPLHYDVVLILPIQISVQRT